MPATASKSFRQSEYSIISQYDNEDHPGAYEVVKTLSMQRPMLAIFASRSKRRAHGYQWPRPQIYLGQCCCNNYPSVYTRRPPLYLPQLESIWIRATSFLQSLSKSQRGLSESYHDHSQTPTNYQPLQIFCTCDDKRAAPCSPLSYSIPEGGWWGRACIQAGVDC